jgi:hypothetical protein
MFLSHLFSRSLVLGGLVAAAALLTAGRASAQPAYAGYAAAPAPYANVSKFDRANAGVAVANPYWAERAVPYAIAPPVVRLQPAPGPLVVTVNSLRQSAPIYVTLRGPDGEVQRYAVEGGRESIQSREVIVRRGASATFRFVVAAPPK